MNAPLSTAAPLPTPAEDLVFGLTRLVDLPGLTAAAGAPLGAEDIEAIIKRGGAVRARAALAGRAGGGPARRGLRERRGARAADLQGRVSRLGRGRLAGAAGARRSMAARGCRNRSGWRCRNSSAPRTWRSASARCSPPARSRRWSATPRRSRPRRWLPRLVSGEWTGTMCLTEPQAGSDLSQVRTRAEPAGDGTLPAARPEDLHHLGRARPDGEHAAPRARAAAGRAARDARHLALRRAEGAAGRRSATRSAAAASSASSASTPRPPASCCSTAPRRS